MTNMSRKTHQAGSRNPEYSDVKIGDIEQTDHRDKLLYRRSGTPPLDETTAEPGLSNQL
ncbi:protein of unknown function [Denitratisoma oestradiolicum]|uniref:Uncharacterized protein n=1 Tax=Denitratisoma oestradiolicum TaxID=311182 RepID=A0A6S6XVH5_9PROT|nr:protein of unknown function [Denitratisoma oestradiolicum]